MGVPGSQMGLALRQIELEMWSLLNSRILHCQQLQVVQPLYNLLWALRAEEDRAEVLAGRHGSGCQLLLVGQGLNA